MRNLGLCQYRIMYHAVEPQSPLAMRLFDVAKQVSGTGFAITESAMGTVLAGGDEYGHTVALCNSTVHPTIANSNSIQTLGKGVPHENRRYSS